MGGFSQGVKQQRHEADHSPPTSAELKEGGAIHLLPYKSSWHSAHLIKHKGNFTFFIIIIIIIVCVAIHIRLQEN
jgi:hypothetical protein